MAPGGAYRSTVNDMLDFITAHLMQQPDALQPVFQLAHETHFRHTTFDVGLAWIIQQHGADHLVYWHNGGTGGYVSFLGMDKQHQVGIVLLSNYGDASVGNYDLDTIGYTLLEDHTQLGLTAPRDTGHRRSGCVLMADHARFCRFLRSHGFQEGATDVMACPSVQRS
jgi:serine-type D-Ala-D-Ala carboxypeptidase/endopeptidase